MFVQMDSKASIGYNVLERMLLNENEKPTKLPLSLLEAITNNFSNEQEIGRGGFAVVYKGMLGIGKVAVKKLSETLDLLDQKYSREVQCLMKARHKNIVRFLGYCSETQGEMVDYEGKLVMADLRNRLLCFEFVPGGSLCDYITDASSGLEWRVRYQIIKGICEGLHYLHENHIVHLDLKPANILVDGKMVPKIADFGISRCFDEKQSKDITSKLIGSIGYLAPEYYSGHITMKLDIYSLGVIIIEVLTGAKGYVAIEKVLDNWRNRLELPEGDTLLQQIRACTEIGIRCIDSNPDDRPTMQCIMQKFEKLESAITSVARVSFLSDSGMNDGGFVNRTSWPPAPPLKRMRTSTKAQVLIQNQMQQQQQQPPSMTQNHQPAASQSLLLPHQKHQQQKLVHQDGRGRKFVPLSKLQQQILLQQLQQQQQNQQQLNKMAAQVPNLSPHQLQLSDQQLQLPMLQKLLQQQLPLLSQPAATLAQLSLIQEQQKLIIVNQRMEKDITPISELHPGSLEYKICVRVSRMWEFRGKSEQNDIKHVDLVLIDQKGDSIYAEIPPDAISSTTPYLEEGNIVYITKIRVVRGKIDFKVVPNPYMLKLNMRTTIVQLNNDIPGFPKYTFSLTPLDKLGDYLNKTEYFLDVIGKIVAVSNAATAYSTSGEQIIRRIVKLQDLRGNTIDLSLSGKRALEFDGETVLDVGHKHHVIAIFVGTLMKTYGQKYTFLSGTAACWWYINENDIPEMKSFQNSLIGNPVSIQRLYLQNEDDALQNLEEKSVIQLKEIDPFVQKGQKYQCTVTIIGIKDDQPWCYRACTVCNSRIYINPRTNKYQCSKEGCPCSQFEWKYKIAFIGTDETYSLEFVLFEKKGSELIGKSAEVLRKQHEQCQIPSDISAWIGFKFTFVVRILANKRADNVDPSFEVIMIKKNHGKQSIVPPIRGPAMALVQSSSSSIAADTDLPPLITIASKKLKTEATSSQTQVSSGIQDLDIEPPGIWQQDDNSDKRNFKEIDENNQKATETYSDIYHHEKSKKKKQ